MFFFSISIAAALLIIIVSSGGLHPVEPMTVGRDGRPSGSRRRAQRPAVPDGVMSRHAPVPHHLALDTFYTIIIMLHVSNFPLVFTMR